MTGPKSGAELDPTGWRRAAENSAAEPIRNLRPHGSVPGAFARRDPQAGFPAVGVRGPRVLVVHRRRAGGVTTRVHDAAFRRSLSASKKRDEPVTGSSAVSAAPAESRER